MSDGNKDEKILVTLATLDERLKNLISSNSDQHSEIIANIKDLCTHVNDEIQKMNNRVSDLEKDDAEGKTERKTLAKICGVLFTLFGLFLTILGYVRHWF